MTSKSSRLTVAVVFVAGVWAAPDSAWAQTAAGTPARWEIEVFAGVSPRVNGSAGAGQLPAAGPTFLAVNGQPTRAATSWYFGDGASLLNTVLGSPSVPPGPARVVPLDSVLTTWPSKTGTGPSFGVRVGRSIATNMVVEFAFEIGAGAALSDQSREALEASRASFTAVFNQLFVPGPVLTNRVVTSTLTPPSNGTRHITASGGLVFALPERGRLQPFVVADVGVIVPGGDALEISMVGDYSFLIAGSPVHDTDRVTIQVDPGGARSVLGLGGGLKWRVAQGGIRADVRLSVSPNGGKVTVDARPSSTSTLGGAVFTSVPPLQFSGVIRSSLSGPPITEFETFSATGRNASVAFSVGYFVKF